MFDPLPGADHWTFVTLRALRTPAVDQVMIALTECGDAPAVWAIALAAAAWLASRQAWRPLGYGVAAVGGGALINTLIKLFIHRTRPTDLHLMGASAYSFPSGHSTTNTVLYGFLLIVLWRQIPWKAWLALAAVCILFVAAICFSRLYLGAHWLTDVIGGLVFATAWLSVLGYVYRRRPAPDISPRGLLLSVFLALMLSGGASMILDHQTDLGRYALVRGH